MGIDQYIRRNHLGIVVKKKSFKDVTTMRVGGKIKHLYYPNSIESLRQCLLYLKKHHRRYFMLGNGSNIVASDRVYYPLVIQGKHLVKPIIYSKNRITVSAFMDLRRAIIETSEKHLSTLTKLAGIPGTVGGAIYMNASAFKLTISDFLISVTFLEDGEIKTLKKEELGFYYRSSEFQKRDAVILEATFSAIYDQNAMKEYHEIIQKRKERHPLEYPNCGSVFKNGDGYFAYEIIKKIYLVGYRIGNAAFSNKHANFIVNLGKAKAKDVYALVILAKKRALIYENIQLKEEIILLNFFDFKFLRKM